MRLSISSKVVLSFSVFVLVALGFGATVHFGLGRIMGEHARTGILAAFGGTLTELGHFHDDGHYHLSFHEDNPGFRGTVAEALELAGRIDAWGLGGEGGRALALAEQMRNFGAAAAELLEAERLGRELGGERRRLARLLNLGPAAAARRPHARHEECVRLALLAFEEVDLPLLRRARELAAGIADDPGSGPDAGRARELLLVLERSYLAALAVASRTGFLSDTMRHFEAETAVLLGEIREEVAREQRRIGTAITATVLFFGLATLALWLLVTRRVSGFVGAFERSLGNIRRGRYDYELGPVSGDELGDALRLVKELADSLGEQIREAEAAREESAGLQAQLAHAQKMESVGRLAGGIAHDFNNLLTGIIGYAELGLLRLPEGRAEREYFRAIYENSERAARLTAQMLAFSRRQVLRRRNVNPNEVISEFAKMLRRMIGEDVVLDLQLQEGVHAVFADPDQLEQILLNLAVNARDSMPGGGRLTISTENVLLDAAYAAHHPEVRPGRHVKIEVTDTGSGIPPEIQDKVFEPFFTTKEPGKGTGLGLATVFGIVRQHEGNIWLYSEPGRGTTFKIYLPAVASGDEDRRQVEPAGTGLRGGESILVVDDNADVRSFLQTALTLHGYAAVAAAGTEEALAHLREAGDTVDVLLTDLIMPGRNGRELADEVSRTHPRIRVIFMSGYADRVFLNGELTDHPGTHFLQKPVTPTALLRKIREVCGAPAGAGPAAG